MKTFYEILGVEKNADDATIKAAYRKLAKEYHPDRNPNDKTAEDMAKAINEAYDTLKDPQKRAAYDYELQPRSHPSAHSFTWTNNPGGFAGGSFDLNEILRDLENSQRRGGWQTPPKNHDIILGYQISLEDAFLGKEAELSYNLDGKETQHIKFKIPRGIHDGVKLRFVGKGDDSLPDIPPGDLYVRISTLPHPTFIRMGYHLSTSIQIDYLDAMLGSEVEIPTIEGGRIKMKIPSGILPGQSLRAAGKGMPTPGDDRGDMMVEIFIESPKLSKDEIQILEELRRKRSK